MSYRKSMAATKAWHEEQAARARLLMVVKQEHTPAALGAEFYRPVKDINVRLMGQFLGGRTPQKQSVCPAIMFGTHPDKALRKLANDQAAEMHILNDYIEHGEIHDGPCHGKKCKPIRRGLSIQKGKAAKNWDGQYGRTALGKGSFYK